MEKFGKFNVDVAQKVGQGKFGTVHPAWYKETLYACKVTSAKAADKEIRVLKILNGSGYVPSIYHNGNVRSNSYFIMDMGGPSLDNVLQRKHVPKLNYFKIGIRCVKILQALHKVNHVHGDIKPANFIFPFRKDDLLVEDQIMAIDFGLSKQFQYSQPYSQHITRFSGSMRYAALFTHAGRDITPRDDLESLGYMLVFLLRGRLPWQGVRAEGDTKSMKKRNKHWKIMLQKGSLRVTDFCQGCNRGVMSYFAYLRQLPPREVPDYDYLMYCLSPEHEKSQSSPSIYMLENSKEGVKHLSANNNAPKKRKRLVPKKQRQWIIVTLEMQNPSFANTQPIFIEEKDENTFMQRITSYENCQLSCWDYNFSDGTYRALLYRNPRQSSSTTSVVEIVPASKPRIEDCMFKYSQLDFSLSDVQYTANGKCLLYFDRTLNALSDQVVKVSKTCFPRHWIGARWKRGYFVTAITTAPGPLWTVVMTKDTKNLLYSEQVIEVGFGYPSNAIHCRWDDGFMITTVAADTGDLSLFVLSKPAGRNKLFVQKCKRSSHLRAKVSGKGQFRVSAFTSARTV